MSSLLLQVPDDTLCNIASFLSAPDLLQWLCTSRHLANLAWSEPFWRLLLAQNSQETIATMIKPFDSAMDAKIAYLTQAYANALPVVEWKHCLSSRTSPTSREGHLAAKLGDYIVITGGFTSDEHVYVKDTRDDDDDDDDDAFLEEDDEDDLEWIKLRPTAQECWRHPQQQHPAQQQQEELPAPRIHSPMHVYGATLTPLDDRRAVRFGGFRGGGYTGECSEVALLTLSTDNDDGKLKAYWQVIHTLNAGMPFSLARAYHTATLIANRYLLILGGMTTEDCIRGEAILDTHTWTWLTETPITQEMKHPKPSGRHGHSAVLDEKRNRIVIFGGGNGNDLLRSGIDNAEVWELCMGPGWKNASNNVAEFQNSLPWEWGLILDDNDEDGSDTDGEDESSSDAEDDSDEEDRDFERLLDIDNGDSNDDEDEEDEPLPPLLPARRAWEAAAETCQEAPAARPRDPNRLSKAEKLCLGRCHLGFKVGPDTVLLAFGSGRPSTNRCLGFHLNSNTFFRPNLGDEEMLPHPRFTAAGVLFGEYNSYLLVHGGYCSQEGSSIENMSVLDLAPALHRDLFQMDENYDYEGHPPVTQSDVDHYHRHAGHPFVGNGGMDMEDLMQNLFVEMMTNGNGGGGGGGVRGPIPPVAVQMLGEIMGEMMGAHDSDDEDEHDYDDEDEYYGEDDDDDDDSDIADAAGRFMFNLMANGIMMDGPVPIMMGGEGRREEEEEDDDDLDNMSEVS